MNGPRFFFAVVSFLLIALITAGNLEAATIQQVNHATEAPSEINDGNINEYPWFTNDGKLFIWTRQATSTDPQRLWVSYFKNHNALWAAPPGMPLPPPQFTYPVSLDVVNNAVSPSETIKALAICDRSSSQPDNPEGPVQRYRMFLFLSIGPPGAPSPQNPDDGSGGVK